MAGAIFFVMEKKIINSQTVREEILRLAEQGNRSFVAGLHPGIEHVLGVRIPDLRKLAKEIARADWRTYLQTAPCTYMEERMLYGLVLGYVSTAEGVDEYLEWVDRFVPMINSWSVCDSFAFAGGKRFIKIHEDRFWPYLMKWMNATGEYQIRFGVVMAFKYFIDEKHVDELLQQLQQINHNGYYVKMAVAWALSVCYLSFPEKTMAVCTEGRLDGQTIRMALQKMVDSYRVTEEDKRRIRELRRGLLLNLNT